MSFKDLKSRRGKNIDKLLDAADKLDGGNKNFTDERIWKPKRDKSGNGFARVRFLPQPGDAPIPWNRFWDHGFQGPTGQWYIERSLSSIDQPDPVMELNSKLWNSVNDDDAPERKQARDQKRRLHYVANVYVIEDPQNPENEGKVMIYEFGKTIFDKIKDAMKPRYADETPMDPFDLWEGGDFKIKIATEAGWVNYDRSEFDTPSEFMNGDEKKLEEVYNQLYDLSEFTDPANYKSYAELKARMNTVLAITESTPTPTPREEASLGDPEPAPAPHREEGNAFDVEDDDDNILDHLAALANAD